MRIKLIVLMLLSVNVSGCLVSTIQPSKERQPKQMFRNDSEGCPTYNYSLRPCRCLTYDYPDGTQSKECYNQ